MIAERGQYREVILSLTSAYQEPNLQLFPFPPLFLSLNMWFRKNAKKLDQVPFSPFFTVQYVPHTLLNFVKVI